LNDILQSYVQAISVKNLSRYQVARWLKHNGPAIKGVCVAERLPAGRQDCKNRNTCPAFYEKSGELMTFIVRVIGRCYCFIV
jgi:hypothetical protein